MDKPGFLIGLLFWAKHKEKINQESIRKHGCPNCGRKVKINDVHKECLMENKSKTDKALFRKMEKNKKKPKYRPGLCSLCLNPLNEGGLRPYFYKCTKCGYTYPKKAFEKD